MRLTNSIYEDLSLVVRRAQRVFIVFVILFIVLVLYFWKIQVLDYQGFWQKSEANRIREVVLPPQRGLIFTRDGTTIIARNIGSFKAFFIRENCRDFEKSCQEISRLLGLETSVLKQRIAMYRSVPAFIPIVVKEDLTEKEVALIEGRKIELPELEVKAEPKRNYPFGTLGAHVLGYLLEVSREELESEKFRGRRLGDLIGKTGVERQYEDLLSGRGGKLLEVVDSIGRNKGELARQDPVPGQNITLTIDFDLQRTAEEILAGREGAVVMLSVKSGEVLAMASYPTFDPNKFINRFTPEEWIALVESPEFPLENRAIRGLYSPGSVFKLVMALAGLDSGIITPTTRVHCAGSVRIYQHPFSCWYKPGHGDVGLFRGIEKSCNIYFYQLGKRMSIDQIASYANMFGFGKATGIDLPAEKKGLVPDREWKNRVRQAPWYPGETISVSIGQGPLLVSPIQVAVFTALIANRGVAVTPHLLKSPQQYSRNRGPNSPLGDNRPLGVDPAVFDQVVKGMWLAVNGEGTARAAKIPGFDICGKTGSTQVIGSERAQRLAEKNIEIKTHSWFSGFAPRDEPEVVVTVLVEHGGGGGETAAPLAKRLFEMYRQKNDR